MPVSPQARQARQADILRRIDAFAAEHGHVNIHQHHKDPDGYALGRVLHELRMSRRKGTLVADFEQALTARGIIWDPGKATTGGGRVDREFATLLDCLREYAAIHGHPNCRQRDLCPVHGTRIGRALTRKREAARTGTLPPAHRQALRDLGVTLDPAQVAALGAASPHRENTYRAHKAQTWTKARTVFLDYVNAGGDLNLVVRNRDYPGFPRLGKHVANAHAAHADGTLPAQVAAEFEALGLNWATGAQRRDLHYLETRIAQVIADLAVFYAEHGHTTLRRDYRTPTGTWLYDQITDLRRLASKDLLRQHDRDRLTAAGIVLPAPGQSLREATKAAATSPRPTQVGHEEILDLPILDDPTAGG